MPTNRNSYMREYRARKRWEVHLDALAEPPEDASNVLTLTVRLDDAQVARLDALIDSVEERFGADLSRPEALRYALTVAYRTIIGADK